MANFPGVYMNDIDGNLGSGVPVSTEAISGLVFDISKQSSFWTTGYAASVASKLKDTVVELYSMADAEEAGIIPYTGEVDEDGATKDLLHGIPYYHIQHFFTINGGNGRLFVAFADCSQNWDILIDMQKAANGTIYQFGVWTEQSLWTLASEDSTSYSVNIVNDLNSVAINLAADYHAPVSILLNANTAQVKSGDTAIKNVEFNKIPTCIINCRYVTVLLAQAIDDTVHRMQAKLASTTPVGNIGAALGCTASASVAESIGWVSKFDLVAYFPEIEFGFGDATLNEFQTAIVNPTKYNDLSSTELQTLDANGYVFLTKYAGLEGHVYFTGDQTCSNKDYRRLAYNRAINKSRRGVRTMLLPDVNSPIKVDPSSGQLSAAQITYFKNKINTVLNAMVANSEISGIGSVVIDASQNILQNDQLKIKYSIIPIGSAKTIFVEEGLALKSEK